jgi:hypothetical protein
MYKSFSKACRGQRVNEVQIKEKSQDKWDNYESNQEDATLQVTLLFPVSSTCFGSYFCPSSGALDGIYSNWYYSPKVLPAGVLDDLKLNYVICEGTHSTLKPVPTLPR